MNTVNFIPEPGANYRNIQEDFFRIIGESVGDHTESARYRIGAINFSLFIRTAADVMMSHGVADKNYLSLADAEGLFFAREFQHILVPGPWMRRKLLATPGFPLGEGQIHVVGWPRLDMLLREKEFASARVADPNRRRVVLWAPTHDFVKRGEEKTSTSTFPAFQECLPALSGEFDVRISVHPRNRPDKETTKGALIDADVVISDFGTMVYEAWALGKPVIFPRWILGDRIQTYLPCSAEAYIMENRIGIHVDSFGQLVDAIRNGCDSAQRSGVDSFMADYLPAELAGNSSARVGHLLRELPFAPRWRHAFWMKPIRRAWNKARRALG